MDPRRNRRGREPHPVGSVGSIVALVLAFAALGFVATAIVHGAPPRHRHHIAHRTATHARIASRSSAGGAHRAR
jgi:hypothetical protein